jgi:hypothetical protein
MHDKIKLLAYHAFAIHRTLSTYHVIYKKVVN